MFFFVSLREILSRSFPRRIPQRVLLDFFFYRIANLIKYDIASPTSCTTSSEKNRSLRERASARITENQVETLNYTFFFLPLEMEREGEKRGSGYARCAHRLVRPKKEKRRGEKRENSAARSRNIPRVDAAAPGGLCVELESVSHLSSLSRGIPGSLPSSASPIPPVSILLCHATLPSIREEVLTRIAVYFPKCRP